MAIAGNLTQTDTSVNLASVGALSVGTNYSLTNAMNNSGQVVGTSNLDAVNFFSHAYRTAPNAAINPLTDDLGTLGGNNSKAYAINSSGQVVGIR